MHFLASYFCFVVNNNSWDKSFPTTIFKFILKVKVVVRKAEDKRRPEPCNFSWVTASIAEKAAVIPYGAQIFFAKETATFIDGPANLLNDPKNSPD